METEAAMAPAVEATVTAPPESGTREPLDQYYTPPALADGIVRLTKERGLLPIGSSVCEPSIGKGAFARAVRVAQPLTYVVGVDLELHPEMKDDLLLDEPALNHFHEGDWLEESSFHYDLIIGNPPFNAAEQHIRAALRRLNRSGAVVVLLRSSFLGSAERIPFFAEFPPAFIDYVIPRPSFVKGATDNAEYAVFTWIPDLVPLLGPPRSGWLRWDKPRKVRAKKEKAPRKKRLKKDDPIPMELTITDVSPADSSPAEVAS